MALLLFYVCLALGVSFLCSVMEAVLLSVSPSYIAQLEKNGSKAGTRLRLFKNDIDRPLAAILSLNTIAHTVGAAGAGAQAAFVFGEAYIGVISAVLTFLILVVSEIIPKTLGAAYWRGLAPVVVQFLRITIITMLPLVKMAEVLTKLLTSKKEEKNIHRDEFIALSEIGEKEGIFHKYESRLLHNLFYLNDILVKDIMTPRTVILALQKDLRVEDVREKYSVINFSRLPVYGENLDDIYGFVLKTDLLREVDTKKLLTEFVRPISVVSDMMSLHQLFEKMMEGSNHIALVVDEYGVTVGVVTMEDFIETLLGLEILDEEDRVEDLRELARKKWRERAARLELIEN